MGDPKKIRAKYETPVHPWQRDRLTKEKSLMKQFGLKTKKEVYKVDTRLKRFKAIAKALVTMNEEQAKQERTKLFNKLKSFGLVEEEKLDNVLGLEIEQLLDRRLQTLLQKKEMATTPSQARQMITHGHVMVDGKAITSPSYLVKTSEEAKITFNKKSPFSDPEHPERLTPEERRQKEMDEKIKDEIASTEKKKEEKKDSKESKEKPKNESKEDSKKEKSTKDKAEDKK